MSLLRLWNPSGMSARGSAKFFTGCQTNDDQQVFESVFGVKFGGEECLRGLLVRFPLRSGVQIWISTKLPWQHVDEHHLGEVVSAGAHQVALVKHPITVSHQDLLLSERCDKVMF